VDLDRLDKRGRKARECARVWEISKQLGMTEAGWQQKLEDDKRGAAGMGMGGRMGMADIVEINLGFTRIRADKMTVVLGAAVLGAVGIGVMKVRGGRK
jgi:hypothetical protein